MSLEEDIYQFLRFDILPHELSRMCFCFHPFEFPYPCKQYDQRFHTNLIDIIGHGSRFPIQGVS